MLCYQLRATEKAIAEIDNQRVKSSWIRKPTLDFFWLVQDKIDRIVRERIGEGLSEVVYVQADGPELEWIQENISGIRMNKNSVVKWSGADALFIVESLPVDWK